MRTLEAWAKPEVAVALEQEEPKTQRPRHARPHTRLDFGRRAICVRVGERYLEGKFGSSGDHLRAILTDSQGNAVRAFTLDASLTTEGVIARSLEFPLPTIEGPIKLDIEYAGTVLESYPEKHWRPIPRAWRFRTPASSSGATCWTTVAHGWLYGRARECYLSRQ